MTRADAMPPPVALGPHLTLQGNRVLNPTGLYFMLASMSMALLFYPLLTAAWGWSLLVDRKYVTSGGRLYVLKMLVCWAFCYIFFFILAASVMD
jgi:hypothetical protein